MLPDMLAYDQVHVDHALGDQAAVDAGFASRSYDSYDNLTWADFDGFVRSVSSPGSARRSGPTRSATSTTRPTSAR